MSFAADRPVRAELFLQDAGSRRFLYATGHFAREFSLPVLGMRASTRQAITVVIVDESGAATAWRPLLFDTDSLPADFPLIQTGVRVPEQMEPGVTLFNLNQPGIGLMVAVNDAGEVIWYYRQATPGIGDIRRMKNGHLLFMDAAGAAEIDMLGNVLRRWRAADLGLDTLHHEIFEMASGNLLTLSTESRRLVDFPTSESNPNAPRATANVLGDIVAEFDLAGRTVQRWSLLDILDPYRIAADSLTLTGGSRDWSHGNAVIEDPRDGSYIVSLRHQDAIIKLDRGSGRLLWILGNPNGWRAPWNRYLLAPLNDTTWPYHQHAPTLTRRGTILLFDNGNSRPGGEYSRVAEFAIDEKNLTVSQVWSYGGPGEELFYSSALGDADELPLSGNVLVTDGFRVTEGIPDSRWGRIFELTRTTPARKVFELTVRDAPGSNYAGWRIYRAERLHSLYFPASP